MGNNPNPNTFKQQLQRTKMRVMHKFLSRFTMLINIGYQGADPDLGAYNEAARYHLSNAMADVTREGGTPAFEIDYSRVKFARGFIHKPVISSCERTGQVISLTWNTRLSSDYNRYTDQLIVTAYMPGLEPVSELNTGQRRTGRGTFHLPPDYTDPVHLWCFYFNDRGDSRRSRENVSDSVYLGLV